MIRFRFALFLLAIVLGAGTAMCASLFPYPYVTETLPNGLKVIVIPLESPGLVAYYSIVRTGSRDEVEQGKSGFAHFFEHMMFHGTKKYPANVYDSLVTAIGAKANAFTTDDLTAYHLNFASEDLEKVIELESDRFQGLSYDKPSFQTEAGAVYGEYRKNVTSPFEVLGEKVQDLAYDVHTYKHTTMGFERDIKAMPEQYEYSQAFFKRFYRPENVVIVVTGDVEPRKTIGFIRQYYGTWESGYVPPAIVQEPQQKAERVAAITFPGRTLPIINIAWKGEAFTPSSKSFAACVLLSELAFGETSELYKRLYVKEQKVQAFQHSVPINRDVPLYEVTAMVKNSADVPLVRDAVYETIARFSATPVQTDRLLALKRRQKYGFLMRLDTPDHVAGSVARFVAMTGGLTCIEEFYSTMETITPQDIMDAAKAFLTPERRTVVTLTGGRP